MFERFFKMFVNKCEDLSDVVKLYELYAEDGTNEDLEAAYLKAVEVFERDEEWIYRMAG